MKIVFDIRPLCSKIVSGIPKYTNNLIKEFLKISSPKHELFFFTNHFKNETSYYDYLIPREKIINSHLPNKIFILTNFLFSQPKIDKLINAHVFYSFHFDLLSLTNPQKRVLTIHDLSFLYFPEFFSFKKNIWHKAQRIKKQIQESKIIITVSQFTKNTIIEKYKIPEEKIKVVYPGISTKKYFLLSKNDENLLNFKQNKKLDFPFILNVGTIEPRKNQILIFEAFRILKTKKMFKDFKLIIVGEKGWKYQSILKYISKNNLEKDVIIWGKADDKDLLYLYNLATVFVFPSFFEGFGFPPLEAQACGVPVIVSSRTSLPEILKDSAFFIDPYKAYELKNALEETILNQKLRNLLIEKGFKNVVKFNWKNTAEEILKIIEENFKNYA